MLDRSLISRVKSFQSVTNLKTFVAACLWISLCSNLSAAADLDSRPERIFADQQIHLQEGWNYVSFSVTPGDLNLSAIFADVIDEIEFVKDQSGQIYSPEYGIDMISPIDLSQGYKVKARSSVTFTISGSPIQPVDVPLTLSEGWNLVPYVGAAAQPVEDALSAIIDQVVRVEDGAGSVYPPEPLSPELDSLRPGVSYLLNVSQPLTFTIANSPADTSQIPPNPGYREVNTLAEALALTDLSVGDRISVLGYHAPNDGGGGTFEYSDNDCGPDGATCYVPDAHKNAYSFNSDLSYAPPYMHLPHDNIVWGSFEARFGTGPDEFVSDKELHFTTTDQFTFIDHSKGTLSYNGSGWTNKILADRGASHYEVSYKYAVSNKRLIRVLEGDYIKPEWLGAIPYDGTTDNTGEVAWAIKIAGKNGQETGRPWDVVFSNMFGFAGEIQHSDNVTLRGAQPWESDGQGLRILPGAALWENRLNWDWSHPLAQSMYMRLQMRNAKVRVVTGPFARFLHLQDFEIDGNWQDNQNPFTHPEEYINVGRWLQDSGDWNGYMSVFNEDKRPGGAFVGEHILFENVHIHDMGGNGIISENATHFTGSNHIRLGNSVRNHLIYRMQTIPDLTVDTRIGPITGEVQYVDTYGFWWQAGIILYAGKMNHVTYASEGHINPFFPNMAKMFHIRGGNNQPGISANSYWGNEKWLSNLSLDFRGSEVFKVLEREGGLLRIEDMTLDTRDDRGFTLLSEMDEEHGSDLVMRNLEVNMHNEGSFHIDLTRSRNVVLENVDINRDADQEGVVGDPYFDISTYALSSVRREINIDNLAEDRLPRDRIVDITLEQGSPGANVYVSNSTINNYSNKGPSDSSSDAQSQVDFYLTNVSFNVYPEKSFDQAEQWMNWWHFENCTAQNTGRTSEDSGTFNYSANGGENFIDIDTNLFWIPDQIDVTGLNTDSAALIDRTEITGSSFEPVLRIYLTRELTPAEQLSLSWSVSVRPVQSSSTS